MAKEVKVPELGESVREATIGRWLKEEGDPVEVGDALVSLETDKVDLEVGAETTGVLAEVRVGEGEDVQVGDVIATIEEKERAEGEGKQPLSDDGAAEPAQEPQAEEERVTPEITPVAEQLAEEHDVDTERIEGSGKEGKIVKKDVQNYVDSAKANDDGEDPSQVSAEQPEGGKETEQAAGQPASADGRAFKRQRLSRRRRTIAERLVQAQQQTAMLTTFNDVDMAAIMELRREKGDEFRQKHGVDLGITSFFVTASLIALKEFPRINSEIDGQELIVKEYYDIGIAVGAEEGLVVPILRNADEMAFHEIELEIQRLAQAAHDNDLSLQELRGGTFSITNGGIYNSLLSTPILNPPQVAILGLHRIEERPTVIEGELAIRPMMYLALSYDHRVVDGREAVQFLDRIKEVIENPELGFINL